MDVEMRCEICNKEIYTTYLISLLEPEKPFCSLNCYEKNIVNDYMKNIYHENIPEFINKIIEDRKDK